MNTPINDIEAICTRLNVLAAECGGGYHTPKEIEMELLSISEKLDDYVFQLVEAARVIQLITGMSNEDYDRRRSLGHIIWEEADKKKEARIEMALENTIGNRINYAILKKGIKKRELAKQLGVSASLISKYISNENRHIPNESLEKMSKILGVSVEWLKTGHDVLIPPVGGSCMQDL